MEPATICPGHGRAVDKDYLRLEWEYFEALIAALAKLKAEGVPIEKAEQLTGTKGPFFRKPLK